MSLSPEEVESQHFREVLRGYDKGQVVDFLAEVATYLRTALQPRTESEDEPQSAVAVGDIAERTFDDALRGYDKEDVRSFLRVVEVHLRALTEPTASPNHRETGVRNLVGADVGGDLDVIARTTRDIRAASLSAAKYCTPAFWSATPEVVDPARKDEGLAVRVAANDLAAARSHRSAAEREVSQLQDEVARAANDLAAARSLRSDAEREMSQLQEEAVRVAELTARELKTARASRAHAEADAAQAACELAAAAKLREEFETATLLRAEAEAKAARAIEELALAEKLRSQAEHDSSAAAKELTEARALRSEVKRELEKIRALAVAEGDSIAAARADREEAGKMGDEVQRQQDAAAKDFSHVQSSVKEAAEVAEFLSDLGLQLGKLHDTGSQELAESIRRLEDQILAAFGEIQDKVHHWRGQALVKVAEEQIHELVQGLQTSKSLGTGGDA